jgi:hypothetical protein
VTAAVHRVEARAARVWRRGPAIHPPGRHAQSGRHAQWRSCATSMTVVRRNRLPCALQHEKTFSYRRDGVAAVQPSLGVSSLDFGPPRKGGLFSVGTGSYRTGPRPTSTIMHIGCDVERSCMWPSCRQDRHFIPSRHGIDTSMPGRPAHQRRRPFGLSQRFRTDPFEGAAVSQAVSSEPYRLRVGISGMRRSPSSGRRRPVMPAGFPAGARKRYWAGNPIGPGTPRCCDGCARAAARSCPAGRSARR